MNVVKNVIVNVDVDATSLRFLPQKLRCKDFETV